MSSIANVAAMCLCVVILLCGTACRKAPPAEEKTSAPSEVRAPGPAEAPARAAAEPAWETQTALDWVTFQAPEGAGWSYSFEMAWHGSLDAPDAVFAVRSDNEVKNLMDSSAAAPKGDVTIAGRPATLHEGKDAGWGPTRIWVLKDPHPSSGKTVAIVVAGHRQVAFQKELDKILSSINVEPVKAE